VKLKLTSLLFIVVLGVNLLIATQGNGGGTWGLTLPLFVLLILLGAYGLFWIGGNLYLWTTYRQPSLGVRTHQDRLARGSPWSTSSRSARSKSPTVCPGAGGTALSLSPLELIDVLAALNPPPGIPCHRYHRILAFDYPLRGHRPRARHRLAAHQWEGRYELMRTPWMRHDSLGAILLARSWGERYLILVGADHAVVIVSCFTVVARSVAPQQLPDPSHVGLALDPGNQPVIADAVQAAGHGMQSGEPIHDFRPDSIST
jgi:hypothetical protein